MSSREREARAWREWLFVALVVGLCAALVVSACNGWRIG